MGDFIYCHLEGFGWLRLPNKVYWRGHPYPVLITDQFLSELDSIDKVDEPEFPRYYYSRDHAAKKYNFNYSGQSNLVNK